MEVVCQNGHYELAWKSMRNERTRARMTLDRPPGLASDLPDLPAASRMRALIEMRALLPVLRLKSHASRYSLRDTAEKTVGRIRLETLTAYDPNTQAGVKLADRISILPVRGYRNRFEAIVDRLSAVIDQAPDTTPVLLRALEALGAEPGKYSSSIRLELTGNMRAEEAVKYICQRLLESMEQNEKGAIANLDSEFLHDFRVAVRRTRSILAQIKSVLPPKLRDRMRTEFKWLGTKTSPTRDLDVYLLDFEILQNRIPPEFRDHLLPLRDFIAKKHQSAHTDMVRALRSKRYQRLKVQWRRYLESDSPSGERDSDVAVIAIANTNIRKAYRRVIKDGRRISDESAPEALHELRKRCKKLRYLLEFFQSLYPEPIVRKLVKSLKELQDVLGEFQDSQIQAEELLAFSDEMSKSGAIDPKTLMTMGILSSKLLERQKSVRDAFQPRFHSFSSPAMQKRMNSLVDNRKL